MITVVQKGFEAFGVNLTTGQIVDSTTWPLEQRLFDQRYLRPAQADEIARFKEAKGETDSAPQTAQTAQAAPNSPRSKSRTPTAPKAAGTPRKRRGAQATE